MRVPRGATLEGFIDLTSAANGINVAHLDPIDRLSVQTVNSLYQIIVVQPSSSVILVQGGRFFSEMTHARLGGSSLGGSLLKLAWIGCGLSMEIHHGDRRIVTSPVRSIAVCTDPMPPRFC